MKEDYLWDKTGSDPEIERLENALLAFRYRETALPALESKVIPFRKKIAPGRFSRALVAAAAACLVFGMIALGFWLQVSRNDVVEVKTEVPEKIEPLGKEVARADIAASESAPVYRPLDAAAVKHIKVSKAPAARAVAAVRRPSTARAPRAEIKLPNIAGLRPDIQLTAEEKFAYDQLMTALSITSSKLKMVKDKVDGME